MDSVKPHQLRFEVSVMPFIAFSPIATPLKPHGPLSFKTESTLIMVEAHGWFISGTNLEFVPKCEYLLSGVFSVCDDQHNFLIEH